MSRLTSLIPKPLKAQEPLANLTRTLSELVGQPPLRVLVTFGDKVGSSRTFTLQVVNQKGEACFGLYKLDVWVSETRGGEPGGSQTAAFPAGVVHDTIEINRRWQVVTNPQGMAQVVLTFTGTRWVHAGVMWLVESSEQATN